MLSHPKLLKIPLKSKKTLNVFFFLRVLQRLTTLISNLAVSMAEKEAAMKQAKNASLTASQLLDSGEVKGLDSNIKDEVKALREG